MRVTFYGTRGSTPVSGPGCVRYGGNTTCLRIESACVPEGMWLVVDAGTGIVPLSWAFMREAGRALALLQTHWHHDHTQGLALSVFPFVKTVPVDIYGPFEHDVGPRQVYETLMRPPVFPVDWHEVASHIRCHNISHPNSTVLLVHPEGKVRSMDLDAFERLVGSGRQVPFGEGKTFELAECLVVRLHRSNHPEQTISYRFEERRTGQVFVFATDHENQDGIPISFRAHTRGADLLVMDCQYQRDKYERVTAGWGHGTPDYVARVAQEAGAKALGLTHHDPPSTDEVIDQIVATASKHLTDAGVSIPVFGCRDYLVVDVGAVEDALKAAA